MATKMVATQSAKLLRGALTKYKSDGASIYALKHTIDFFSLARLRNLFSRKRKIMQTP